MAKLYGWAGKILRVDLTGEKISTILTENYVPKFVGGRGIGARIHWEEVPPVAKAFDPENVITFMTGPLAGTFFGERTVVQGVSPVGYPVEHYIRTTMGGHWAAELKFAGYDGVVVKGKAAKPVYLWLNDGDVEIRGAEDLWGKDTYSTQERLWSRHNENVRMAVIGPAGENLCRHAAIISDDSSVCGTGGFGAVMGSKNLKAIAVRGTGEVSVARPQELLDLAYYTQRLFTRKEGEVEPPAVMRQYRKVTTKTALYEEGLKGTARIGFMGCFGCPVCCGMSVRLLDGSRAGTGAHKCNEAFSVAVEKNYYQENAGRGFYERVKLQDLLGVSHWWWTELRYLIEEGLLNAENTGLDMNKENFVGFTREMIYKTAYRDGIFDKMADGLARFCLEYLGTEKARRFYQLKCQRAGIHGGFRMGNMGQPPQAWNVIPTIVSSVLSNVAATEVRAFNRHSSDQSNFLDTTVIKRNLNAWKEIQLRASKKWFGSEQAVQDLWDWKWGPYTVPTVIKYLAWRGFQESLVTCAFNFPRTTSMYTPDYMGDISIERRLYSAVTGSDMTEEDEMTYGSRLFMQERAIKVRQGHRREDDWFVDIAFDEIYDCRKELSDALDEFYTTTGIEVATAIPRRSTFEQLGLKDVADDLKGKYGVSVPA